MLQAGTSVAASVAALIAFCSVGLVAITHIADWHRVDHVSGVWMGLAKYLREGVLYPPLYEDGVYGGTRYMPVKTVVDTGASLVSGEYLVSGKVVGLLAFAALVVVLFVAARAAGCPPLVAIALCALPVATGNGVHAATSNYGDTLPMALQVAALAVVAQRTSRARAGVSALLCCLAFFTKLSAIWAPPVVLMWLVWRRRSDAAAAFVVALIGFALAAFGVVELASEDRFRQNFAGLGNSGFMGLDGLVHVTPHKTRSIVEESAPAMLVLAPLVLGAYLLALRLRRFTVYHLALPVAAVVLVLVLNDIGAAENHLLDVEVLVATVVGASWPWLKGRRHAHLTEAVALTVVCVALVFGYVEHLARPTRDATRELVGSAPKADPANPLGGHLSPADTLLSEDASIPISLGQTPVVLDPYMLLRIDRDHPAWGDDLVRRLDDKQFDKVVMNGVPDPNDRWWHRQHFGPRIAAAIFRNYRRSVTINRYSIFVPRDVADA